VAVLKNSALVGYFVPAEAISNEQHRTASIEEIRHSLKSRKAITQPVLDYLKDK
jgi:antitoxin StbD